MTTRDTTPAYRRLEQPGIRSSWGDLVCAWVGWIAFVVGVVGWALIGVLFARALDVELSHPFAGVEESVGGGPPGAVGAQVLE